MYFQAPSLSSTSGFTIAGYHYVADDPKPQGAH